VCCLVTLDNPGEYRWNGEPGVLPRPQSRLDWFPTTSVIAPTVGSLPPCPSIPRTETAPHLISLVVRGEQKGAPNNTLTFIPNKLNPSSSPPFCVWSTAVSLSVLT
jgi:hypothetical protein